MNPTLRHSFVNLGRKNTGQIMAAADFSGLMKITDLDDFITPSQVQRFVNWVFIYRIGIKFGKKLSLY